MSDCLPAEAVAVEESLDTLPRNFRSIPNEHTSGSARITFWGAVSGAGRAFCSPLRKSAVVAAGLRSFSTGIVRVVYECLGSLVQLGGVLMCEVVECVMDSETGVYILATV